MIKNQNKFLYCFKQFSINFKINNKVYYWPKSYLNNEISFDCKATTIFLTPGQYGSIYAHKLKLIYYVYNYPRRYISFHQYSNLFDFINQIILKYKRI